MRCADEYQGLRCEEEAGHAGDHRAESGECAVLRYRAERAEAEVARLREALIALAEKWGLTETDWRVDRDGLRVAAFYDCANDLAATLAPEPDIPWMPNRDPDNPDTFPASEPDTARIGLATTTPHIIFFAPDTVECPGCMVQHKDGHADSCACNHCPPEDQLRGGGWALSRKVSADDMPGNIRQGRIP